MRSVVFPWFARVVHYCTEIRHMRRMMSLNGSSLFRRKALSYIPSRPLSRAGRALGLSRFRPPTHGSLFIHQDKCENHFVFVGPICLRASPIYNIESIHHNGIIGRLLVIHKCFGGKRGEHGSAVRRVWQTMLRHSRGLKFQTRMRADKL
jgi:hypothetical protein